jgi:hypothetical protein
MINEKWDYSPKDLPWWARAGTSQPPDPTNPGVATPAEVPIPITPVFGRILLFRLFVAATFLFTVWIGGRLARAENLATVIVGSCLVGFIFGLLSYLRRMIVRWAADVAGPFRPETLPPMPTYRRIATPPLVAPLAIVGSIAIYTLFANRFIGLAILIPATLYAFFQFGDGPIRFMRQKYLAELHSDQTIANELRSLRARPDCLKLATFLIVAWLVPAFTSNTFGIIAVLGLCVIETKRSVQQLAGKNNWKIFLFGVWRSGVRLFHEYLDYQESDKYHWRPQETVVSRTKRAAALLLLLDLTLLVSLAYYVPWEPFAALFVPQFRADALFVPDAAMTNYRWLAAPFMLSQLADPLAGYLICFIVAIPLYLVLPLIIVYLLYLEPLTAFEAVDRHIEKHYERLTRWI